MAVWLYGGCNLHAFPSSHSLAAAPRSVPHQRQTNAFPDSGHPPRAVHTRRIRNTPLSYVKMRTNVKCVNERVSRI